MQKLSTKFTIVALLLIIIACGVTIDLMATINKPLGLDKSILIDIKKGSSIKSLANNLRQKEILDNSFYFIAWARITGIASKLKAGEYRVESSNSLKEILDKIVSGKTEQYKLTLVEGWTFKEVLKAINKHPQIQHTITDKTSSEIASLLKVDHPEGRFYPDTYFITKNTKDIDVLRRALKAMDKALEKEWSKREPNLPFDSPYQSLILASIVEKESAVADERAKIAGVFINRLRKKMRLQTDPTVIYGIGDEYDGDIRFRDLRKDTPYNTYTRNGLPPTPIAMPGLAAIKAVLHPEKTDALYFVAFGDGSGRHLFSNNLAQHEEAVNKYQKKR